MGKIGSEFNINFEETNLTDSMTFDSGKFASNFNTTVPDNGIAFISVGTSGTDYGSCTVSIYRNDILISKSENGHESNNRTLGTFASASLVLTKGDRIKLYVRNSATSSTTTVNVLSSAGKLQFSVQHM